ncbi:choice-of-anchor L domain-containing protein [Flavobacterium sp.]|uniref:choice-of-anchor L domain-containing protein n=1 Tax=Flavobacterium sp. TaxID=239 RepID=UPI0039E37AB1
MKRLILIFALAISAQCFSQAITVSTSSHTVPQLVNNVLINSPCVSATNITWKTGTNFGSSNGIGYFNNTNMNFPMPSGVILSTGNVANAPGPNSVHLNDGDMSWPGDADLEATLAAAGIPMNSVNATVLEFDFTPISPQFSFDFLFASEEYGNFQCEFSDAFAFLLTNVNTGVTTNLAVVPNTNLPISVVTIRDFLYNSSCPSANAQFFGSYNGGSAAAGSATNYNGQTKLMNASAVMVPGTPYHIKLVIADRTDNESDSAIFINSDSFNIGQDALGLDLTVANNTAICHGQPYTINSGLSATTYAFSWKRNNATLPGENGPSLTITQAGTYELTYQYLVGTCTPITDSVLIEYYPEITTQNPVDLYKCIGAGGNYVYDLSYNTPIVKTGLNPATTVTYHSSQTAAEAGTGALPLNYSSTGSQTIYVRIKSADTPCHVVKSFQLLTLPSPVANQPLDMTMCARSQTINNAIFNIASQTATVLGGQAPAHYTVTYHTSLANANSGTNPLGNTYIGINNAVVYVRVQNATDPSCFSTTSFTLHIAPLPPVDSLNNLVLCDPYVLPVLTNGNYFTGPNGTGTPKFAGDIITETQTIYIFNQPGGPDSCSAGSSFKITIINPLELSPGSGTYCGSFTLPPLENGVYYPQPGGQGTPLTPGTEITESQTLYVYFESLTPPFCIIDTDFTVTILPTVEIGQQPNIFDCTSYILPALPGGGTYYTEPNKNGTEVPAGTTITTTTTLYAYADTGAPNFCKSEKQFTVYIGFTAPADISQCNGYTLPTLPIGNYFTGPAGTGDMIPAGTILEETATVYIYIPKAGGGGPNCTDNVHFTAYIAQPLIDHLEDVTVCDSYTLPVITRGTYYTGPEQSGTELAAGDIIASTQTIYIFKRSTPTCYNEDSFTVTVNPKPAIDSRSDIDVCNSYTLTALGVGNYFTGPGGTGTMLPAGTVINNTQDIYIYAVGTTEPACVAENHFTITVFSIHADDPADVTACDSYTLPALTVGNYYSQPGGPAAGEGTLMHAGDVITTSKTIYVYTESGERINCTDENSFNITINNTPVIAPMSNQNACNSYTLPALPVGQSYYTGTNKTGTQLFENDVITATQTLYVYAETGTTPNCAAERSFVVTIFNVDELPNVTTCASYTLPALTKGRFYTGPNGTGQVLNAGHVITSTATIYIYATSPFSPICSDESSFQVTIVPTPVAHSVSSTLTTVCDEDGTNDGITNFTLTDLNAAVLGTQTGAEFTVAYYATMDDAIGQVSPITTTNATLAFARVNNTLTANCFGVQAITILVNKIPEPTPIGGIICYDSRKQELINAFTIVSGLSASNHTFEWFDEAGELVGTGSSYTAVLPGEYSVIATNSLTGCPSAETFVTVSPSEPALVSYTITDDFADSQTIVVNAQGVGGDYEYMLDHGPWQDSNVFDNVSSGTHTVTVRDKNGCGTTTSQALVVNYPKYFTPNGDGFHDTWNIVDLKQQLTSTISIFDRYGKLLTKIKPSGAGWDGTFNGQAMPSTDYWFVVNYEEDGIEKEFKAHFAMKR